MYDHETRKLLRAVHIKFVGLEPRGFKVGKYYFQTAERNLGTDKVSLGKVVQIKVVSGLKPTDQIVGTIELSLEGANVKTCVIHYAGGNGHLGESPKVVQDFVKAALNHVMEYAKANPFHIKHGLTPDAERRMKQFAQKMGKKK